MKFDNIYNLNDSNQFNKVVKSHSMNEWHENNEDEWFMILLDEESDAFIISVEDIDNEYFVLISPNTYYSLSVNMLSNIMQLVSEFCDAFEYSDEEA